MFLRDINTIAATGTRCTQSSQEGTGPTGGTRTRCEEMSCFAWSLSHLVGEDVYIDENIMLTLMKEVLHRLHVSSHPLQTMNNTTCTCGAFTRHGVAHTQVNSNITIVSHPVLGNHASHHEIIVSASGHRQHTTDNDQWGDAPTHIHFVCASTTTLAQLSHPSFHHVCYQG